jgi:hypothetical protein
MVVDVDDDRVSPWMLKAGGELTLSEKGKNISHFVHLNKVSTFTYQDCKVLEQVSQQDNSYQSDTHPRLFRREASLCWHGMCSKNQHYNHLEVNNSKTIRYYGPFVKYE